MESKEISITPEKNGTEQKKINFQFKVLYAIGIIMVVAGHANAETLLFLNEIIHVCGFHMALFIFASGYFYNKTNDDRPFQYIWGKVKRLLIPYFLWNVFYGVIVYVLSKFGFKYGLPITWQKFFYIPFVDGPAFSFNLSAWFVIPLFVTEVYNVLIRKLLSRFDNNQKEIFLLIFNCLLGVAGIYLANKGYNTFGWLFLTRFLYFACFYSFGYIYKIYLEKKDTFSSFWYFTIIIMLELLLILIYGHSPTYSIVGMFNFDNPVVSVFAGILGIAFWLRVSRILSPMIGKSKYLNAVADNTFSIMINHELGFFILKVMFYFAALLLPFLPEFPDEKLFFEYEYLYLPRGRGFPVLYVFVGIAFAVLLQKAVDCVAKAVKRMIRNCCGKEV